MDYKRHIKTVLLISLIVLSFVLVVRLWSVGNYFGSGFKDFIGKTSDRLKAPIVRIFKEFGRDNATHNFEYVLSPKRIVVNSSDKRSILNSPDKDFEKFYEVSTKIIGQVKSGEVKRKSVESVSSMEYFAALKSKSVLVDFDNKLDYSIFSMLVGGDDSFELLEKGAVVREFIINISDNVLNYTSIYIMDYANDTAYKYLIDIDKTELGNMIEEHLLNNASAVMPFYSFELDFHTGENTDGTPAKVVFNPLTTIGVVPKEIDGVKSTVFSEKELVIDEAELLKMFNMNIMVAGKYTDIDGSKNYVEKNATLKISSDGFIEYSAKEPSRGISISDNTSNQNFGIVEALTVSTDFMFDINKLMPKTEEGSIRISNDLTEKESSGKYTFFYDYYVNGIPVFQTDKETGELGHSVEVTVNDGYLKYYKQYIKKYAVSEERTVQETMLAAADVLVSKITAESEQLKISKAHECFIDSSEENLLADWVFEISETDDLYR